MSNRLLKTIKQGRYGSIRTEYLRLFGRKGPEVLDQIIPNLTANLKRSSELFIDAIFKNDRKFIDVTSISAMRSLLFRQLQDLKRSQIQISRIPAKPSTNLQSHIIIQNKPGEQQGSNEVVTISPYVIFGKSMADRRKEVVKDTNSYFATPSISLHDHQDKFSLFSYQIYGFHCFYNNPLWQYQVTDRHQTNFYPPQEFVVTFETDSVDHQFFVADFNFMHAFQDYQEK